MGCAGCVLCGIALMVIPIPLAWFYYTRSRERSNILKLRGAGVIWAALFVCMYYLFTYFFGDCKC